MRSIYKICIIITYTYNNSFEKQINDIDVYSIIISVMEKQLVQQ